MSNARTLWEMAKLVRVLRTASRGDVLALKVRGELKDSDKERLFEGLAPMAEKHGIKFLVLDGGIELIDAEGGVEFLSSPYNGQVPPMRNPPAPRAEARENVPPRPVPSEPPTREV